MKKIFIKLIFLLVLPIIVFAQTENDSKVFEIKLNENCYEIEFLQ